MTVAEKFYKKSSSAGAAWLPKPCYIAMKGKQQARTGVNPWNSSTKTSDNCAYRSSSEEIVSITKTQSEPSQISLVPERIFLPSTPTCLFACVREIRVPSADKKPQAITPNCKVSFLSIKSVSFFSGYQE